jgi:hypothetical protein
MSTAAAAKPQPRPATHVIYAAAASRDQGEPTGGWHEAGVARAEADGRLLVFYDSKPIPDHYAGFVQLCPLGSKLPPFNADDFDDLSAHPSTPADPAPKTRPPTHTIYTATTRRDDFKPSGGWQRSGLARREDDGRVLAYISTKPVPDQYCAYIQLSPIGTEPPPFNVYDFADLQDR